MPSILDLMPKDEAEKLKARAKRRLERTQVVKGQKVSPEVYMLSEFGYYYGWQAVMAVRSNEIDMDEMQALLEGARKVWYSKLVETAGINTSSRKFTSASNSYPEAIKQYTDKADLG